MIYIIAEPILFRQIQQSRLSNVQTFPTKQTLLLFPSDLGGDIDVSKRASKGDAWFPRPYFGIDHSEDFPVISMEYSMFDSFIIHPR